MKQANRGHHPTDSWIRYRCDGPICSPGSIQEWSRVTPNTSFCQVDIPTIENMIARQFPAAEKSPTIYSYGWVRIIRSEEVAHICPKCQTEFENRLTRKLYKLMQRWDRHDFPTITKIAAICSSPNLYDDLSNNDYKR